MGRAVGCNHYRHHKDYVFEVLVTIKANLLQDRLISNVKQVNRFYQEISQRFPFEIDLNKVYYPE